MHGSKKWIKDYRGKFKRSRNRTKIDFYAGLRRWDIQYVHSFGYRTNEVRGKDFCPQCKHVQKAILNDTAAYREAEKKVRDEWKALYGERYYVKVDGKNVYWWDYFHQHKDYPGALWSYDFRNYFCFKHERMYELEHRMWYENTNGKKANYGWMVKHERRKYRRQCKQKMARAKYDEDVYDEILPHRRGWLD